MTKKILIIDDEKVFCQALGTRFEKAGYEVFLAHDGIQGYQVAKEKNPDLILLDILIPGGDGIQLCRKIKTDDTFGNPYIVLMSGIYRDMGMTTQAKNMADDFILKPFDYEVMVEKINRYFSKAQPREDDINSFIKVSDKDYHVQISFPDKEEKAVSQQEKEKPVKKRPKKPGTSVEDELDDLMKSIKKKQK